MSEMDNLSLFDGPDDEGAEKDARLANQLQRVYMAMTRHPYAWSLKGLADEVGAPEASVAARLRDLRKPRFGEHTVIRKHQGGGLYTYRLVPSECGLLDGRGYRSAKADARRRLELALAKPSHDHTLVTVQRNDLREILR